MDCVAFSPANFAPSSFVRGEKIRDRKPCTCVSATARTLIMKRSGGGSRQPAQGFGAKLRPSSRFKFTGDLRPGMLSAPRRVPEHIARPKYAKSGIPRDKRPKVPWDIEEKDAETIERMRVAGRLAREVLDEAGKMVLPGVTTDEIDEVVHREAIARKCYPSPLNYNKFPKSCCTSLNEVVCHGIPDSTVLVDGDIINIDVTVFFNGVHGDCSETYLVGDTVDERGKQLVKVTHDALWGGISVCGPGVPVSEIGCGIEKVVKKSGMRFSIVRNFVGHGIGQVFHTTPNVLHFHNNEPAGLLRPGMTFTIEPMINEGTHKNITWPDDWTAVTLDGKRSVQFEHTLLIVEDGVEVLTKRLENSPKLFWEE